MERSAGRRSPSDALLDVWQLLLVVAPYQTLRSSCNDAYNAAQILTSHAPNQPVPVSFLVTKIESMGCVRLYGCSSCKCTLYDRTFLLE
jgi:hypothetical protein